MKAHWLVLVIAVVALAISWRESAAPEFQVFAAIPVRENGRIKPLDTVARNALLMLDGGGSVLFKRTSSSVQWLANVLFNEAEADRDPVFLIRNPGVLRLCEFERTGRDRFSYHELEPSFSRIDAEARQSGGTSSAEGSSYRAAVLKLRDNIALYQRLKKGLQTVDGVPIVSRDIERLAGSHPELRWKMQLEIFLNRLALFDRCVGIYLGVFVLVCFAWVARSEVLRRAAFLLLLLGLVLHSSGIGGRMILQGRPPVTNLYSSVVFVGWGAVLISIWLERRLRDGVALAGASLAGFSALIVAQHLAKAGDTLEMLQAVLDTHLWLAAHVLTISIGYSSVFLAGGLAAFFVFREAVAPLGREAVLRLEETTHGVIRFALLFNVAGTLLGGLWADQCWGRFWGWDPKENGALLVVLWCAAIVHGRRWGHLKRRGLMAMALGGNAVAGFSWFGVNMLGVGLHAYGGLGERAWPLLGAWIFSQCALASLALLPLRRWRILSNRQVRRDRMLKA